MSKIKKILIALTKLITQPKTSLLTLLAHTQDGDYKRYINQKYNIDRLPTVSILDLFDAQELTQTISNYTYLEGASLPTDLLLLKLLAQQTPNKQCNFLEIGSWRGESIANVAQLARQCTALTLSKTQMLDMGFGSDFAQAHGVFSSHQTNIKTIYANSLHFDFKTLNDTFDLIFIDGDHHHHAVKSDTKNVFPLLKNEASTLVWHDYTHGTEQPRYAVLAAILDGLPISAHINLYHIANTMCCIYTTKNLKKSYPNFPSNVETVFEITLKAKRFSKL